MKYTLTKYEFVDFMGNDQGFSYDGLCALFDHIIEIEEDTGEEIEFDKVAFRSYYSEYFLKDLFEELNLFFEEDEKESYDLIYEKIEDELSSRGIWFERINQDKYLIEDSF